MTAPTRSTEIVVVNGLYALKPWYSRRLRSLVDVAVARGVSPDAFSALGVLGAAVAAVAIAYGWWLAAAVALAVRLAGANLDGAVARTRGWTRPWGFVVNELGDRAADLLMFAGLAALAARSGEGWGDSTVALVCAAALAASLPTFVALAAAAASVDADRLNGGPVGKTERCALAALAAALPAALPAIAVVIVVGSLVTASLRLTAAYRELR